MTNHLHCSSCIFKNEFANHIFQFCSGLLDEPSIPTPCRTPLMNVNSQKT
ncbi:hypothetical protein F383_04994 [Gossypium arboreum]|uniref:Uncharacterized protein n=1 Tax=Gossypium arboreum TaxID=29729 RepID=A0A0B0PHV4_GOSAR|nr:hypothetical protein F383_04994 [Gossypium arboreum]